MAWYHGSANHIDRFKPVNYGEDTGDPSHYTPQSFESGKVTYLTRDPEEAASFAWSLDDREDAISSPEMALSFSPHKNLSGMSRMQFQDFDEYGRSPSDFVDEMIDLHAEE